MKGFDNILVQLSRGSEHKKKSTLAAQARLSLVGGFSADKALQTFHYQLSYETNKYTSKFKK